MVLLIPQIDLPPSKYRSDRPRVISRREAGRLLALNVFIALGVWWLVAFRPDWWSPLLMLIPGISMGALITRLWPLFFLEDES